MKFFDSQFKGNDCPVQEEYKHNEINYKYQYKAINIDTMFQAFFGGTIITPEKYATKLGTLNKYYRNKFKEVKKLSIIKFKQGQESNSNMVNLLLITPSPRTPNPNTVIGLIFKLCTNQNLTNA